MRKNSKLVKLKDSYTNKNRNNDNNNCRTEPLHIDDLDVEILDLLIPGNYSKQISSNLSVPLSTIQRRTRKLFQKSLITSKIELDYDKIGFKACLIHIYLSNDCVDTIGQKLANKKCISNVSVHVGNSDVVCTFA